MARLKRFDEHRFVGTRDDMIVYDCDDGDQLSLLESRVDEGDLVRRLLVSSFAPDTLEEARNRGFRPLQPSG